MQALLAAPEPDDPQDAVVARQVKPHVSISFHSLELKEAWFWATATGGNMVSNYFSSLDWFVTFPSFSIRKASLCTRQQPSTGPTSMRAPNIGYLTSNLTNIISRLHLSAPWVWRNVEAATGHGHWWGELKSCLHIVMLLDMQGPARVALSSCGWDLQKATETLFN